MTEVSNNVSPDMMNADLQQFVIFGEYVDISEMTVKCYGCSQFIHGTPETFGCKVWDNCGISWYGFNFNQ